MRLVGEIIFSEHVWDCAEGRGFDKVGAHREKALMHFANSVRASQHDVFVAALELGTAEIFGSEIEPLDVSAEGAVDDENTLGQQLTKELNSSKVSQHQRLVIC